MSSELVAAVGRHRHCLRAAETATIYVIGHSDERGDDALNDALSLRRASAVAAALRAGGVPNDRLVAEGRGKRERLCTDPSDECHARNRRVEIRLKK